MEKGDYYVSSIIVEEEHLACNVGSGDLSVLATPTMVMLMENAAMMCVCDDLKENETTVGGEIHTNHIKPTKLGGVVKAIAELVSVDGRKLTFKVQASDEDGIIGEGEHVRFIVDKEKFMNKLS